MTNIFIDEYDAKSTDPMEILNLKRNFMHYRTPKQWINAHDQAGRSIEKS